MSDFEVLDHSTLSNAVYWKLCDALTKGRFQPGDRLKIRELAKQLGTSVTPTQDPILRLTNDDALVFRSARDIRIPAMNEDKYLEIRTIRLRLEAITAEAAAQVATHKDLLDLEAILMENEAALKAGDLRRSTGLNQSFHFLLPSIARMPVLQGIMRRTWLQKGATIADSYSEGGHTMIDFHYPMLEALRKRDSTAAAQAIMDDIYRGSLVILEHIQANTPAPA